MTPHENHLLWLVERSARTWDIIASISSEEATKALASGMADLLRREASKTRSTIKAAEAI
jgi:hypothetical protein